MEQLYKKLYFKLFGVLADATELLERGNVWDAEQLLIRAQQEAEDYFVEHADESGE